MAISVYTTGKKLIQLEDSPLATAGAEGAVHRVIDPPSYPNCCVKIFNQHKRTPEKRRKLEFMIQNTPPNSSANYILCWPKEIIFNSKDEFAGYIMPLAFQGSQKLYELTVPKISKKLGSEWNKFDRTLQNGLNTRLMLCCNLSAATHHIHLLNKYTVIDYKPQNILVTIDGKISITDIDSFQATSASGIVYNAEVVTQEYAPPEFLSLNPTTANIPVTWDRFSMAVTFYELLFGIHPFAGTSNGQYSNVTTIGEKIRNGLFVHGSKSSHLIVIPPPHKSFSQIPTTIRSLFIRALDTGHNYPILRPSAEDWGKALFAEFKK